MEKQMNVQDYIEGHSKWKQELNLLRDIILETELEETIKWGAPCYTYNGKNVIGMTAFKSYAGLWFHQGVFLKDEQKVLINAQEGTTKALRQWRFTSIKEIDPKLVKRYIEEAIANQKAGKELKPAPKQVKTPKVLEEALKADKALNMKYKELTPGKRKEYAEHIGSAKQEKTQITRLEKAIPLILSGVGLHDKYK